MSDLLLLEDELVDERCPMHADLELGDITALDPARRHWLEDIACPELHLMFDFVRRCQLRLQREDLDDYKRSLAKEQMSIGIGRIDRLREDMRRFMAGEPEPARSVPQITLWDR